MPLVRLQVKNEFGLGQPELYRETNREDPKAVLDGVAVAGLVGILRQLGDLADFAAEVFHGLQEQVMTTASRSHRLMVRVQNIEAALPPLEKAVLAQTSHIHFAYTAGCEWHPRIKPARNHFIYNDLPHFIMDSYEECRDPPRMHLLDKFDTGGPGSCFRRYSDPTFFKRASADLDESYSEKIGKARKSRKNKKKRSSRRNGELSRDQIYSSSGRMQFVSSNINGRTSSQTPSTIDISVKSDQEDHSNSFDSNSGAGYVECVFHPRNAVQSDEQDRKETSSSRLTQKTDNLQTVSPRIDDSISYDSLEKQIASGSSGVTWDEKEEIVEEIVEAKNQACDRDKISERLVEKHDSDLHANETVFVTNNDYSDIVFSEESILKPVSSRVHTEDFDSEPDNYVDALNTIESESENDLDCETKREVQQLTSHVTHGMIENEVTEAPSDLFDNNLSDVVSQTGYTVSGNREEGKDLLDSLQENQPLRSEPHASNLGSVSPSDVHDSEKMTRDSVSFDKETSRDLPNSMQEIPPLTSEPHVPNLGPGSPSDDPYSKEMTGDTVSLNKETCENSPDSLQEIPPLTSELHASHLASVNPPGVSVGKEITDNIDDSYSSESPTSEQVHLTCGSSVLDNSVCNDTIIGSITVNDTVSAPTEVNISPETSKPFPGSESVDLPDEEAGKIDNICKQEETRRESLGDRPVRFWTNGGLLGLEPSKPPDFTKSSSLSTKSEMDGGSGHNSMQKSNGYKEKQELSEVAEKILKESGSRFLSSSHNDDQTSMSESISGSSQMSNGFGQTERNSLGEIRVSAPGSVLPATSHTKDNTETNHVNGENSSRVFGLGHRLLINSLHRKVSFDEKSGPQKSLKSVILEQNEQNGIAGQSLPETTVKEKVGVRYPVKSLPPSPPLEHMKISFHPVSGLETSKLKLKFPDGSNHQESVRDMFPSFRLVPEASVALDDAGFHSDDDDTFCRSSPYISDDCRSPRSDYNSDQWESDETSESSNNGVHDTSRRTSSTESMSSTKEQGGVSSDDTDIKTGHGTCITNGVEHSLSGPSLDFPSFDNVNPVLEKESNKHSECNDAVMSRGHREPTRPPPPPPPLPPTNRRVLKPELDTTNGTQHHMSEDVEHFNYQRVPESAVLLQPRLTEAEQIQIIQNGHDSHGNFIHKLKGKLDQRKLNGQKEATQLTMGKELDEREDFLYQIRTKSFNLRPTVTGKSNATTGSTANVKVTAILEKANAIRQVVASDDGEDDDNWSDT